jgi:hypothetical protein
MGCVDDIELLVLFLIDPFTLGEAVGLLLDLALIELFERLE